jgi:hypothetical protein
MRVFQTVVTSGQFHDFNANADKVRLVETLAKIGADAQCDLLHLPAGIWVARDMRRLNEFIHTASRIACRHKIAIVGGTDIRRSKKPKLETKRQVTKGKKTLLPNFGFAVDVLGNCYGENGQWRQLSTTNANAKVASAVDAPQRIFGVNGSHVAVVVCGEMHNQAIRTAIAKEHPHVVLVSGHLGLGQGLIPTLIAFYKAAHVPILHSQHLAGKNTKLHMIDIRGISRPVSVRSALQVPPPTWVAAVIRKV